MAEGKCEVWFYHLERSSLDQVLPELLEKTLARGWRALVQARDPDRLASIDDRLWTYRDESFLAHGRATAPDADRQPVLLATDRDVRNGAQALFIVDGAEIGSLNGFERCIVVFDGRDDQAVEQARGAWRDVKATGAPASYWRQDEEGRWNKAA